MARFVYLLLLALAIAGQAGCGSIATTPADDPGISIVHELAASPAIALPEIAGAQAAGPPIETMVDMEPVDDSILASVLDGFTSSDWLPYENAQAPPKLALSSTTRTHPKWVFSQNNPSFDLPLQASLLPRSSAGSGTPTFVRATAAAHTDFEGIVRQVPAGAARFQGARYARNLLTFSEDFSNAAWYSLASGTGSAIVKTPNFGTAPDSTTTACRVVADRGVGTTPDTDRSLLFVSGTTLTTPTLAGSVWLKSNTGSTQNIAFRFGNNPVYTTLVVTTSWQRFGVSSSRTTGTQFFGLGGAGSSSDQLLDFLVWHPMWSVVTGQANTAPAEYVPSLATANADSGAVGTRYFTTLNANTVTTGNVVIEATGAQINSSAAAAAGGVTAGVVDSGGPLGYLAEGARSNLVLWSRDMTNIAWTPGATMTAALTSIGVDGSPNSATRLTAGAVAATNTISQIVTTAASSKTYGAMIKCITCTGPVSLSQDAFVSSTDISASLSTGVWKLVQLTASVLNPAVGIKIDTPGDAIDVDMNMFEEAAFTSSPIVTTTAAVERSGDVLTYPAAQNINNQSGSTYAEYLQVPSATLVNPTAPAIIGDSATGAYFLGIANSNFSATTYDNTSASGASITQPADGTLIKGASYWGAGVMGATFNGNSNFGQATYDGSFGVPTSIRVGGRGGGGTSFFGTIRLIRIYPNALNQTKLRSFTVSNDWGAPVYADLSDSRYLISANDERYRKVANGAR